MNDEERASLQEAIRAFERAIDALEQVHGVSANGIKVVAESLIERAIVLAEEGAKS